MYKGYTAQKKESATVYFGTNRIALSGDAAKIVNDIVLFTIILSAIVTLSKALN